MNALVTGGTGFIGRYLVRQLLWEGHAVRCLVRDVQHAREILGADGALELVAGDITKPDSVSGVAEGIEQVFHLAAMGHVSAISEEAFKQFVAVNVGGTVNLIRECAQSQVKRFIHFSSTAAMGLIKKELVDESVPPEPKTPYQKSKLESEKIALSLGHELGVSTLVLRPCMVYGVGGTGEFFKMCRMMRKGIFPKVGRGKNLTPLVHVHDVVQAAVKAAERGADGHVYIICSERSLPLDELREMVVNAWGTRSCYPYVPVSLMFAAALFFEIVGRFSGRAPLVTRRNIASTVWDREFSIHKAEQELGYKQTVQFVEGINETVNWYKTL